MLVTLGVPIYGLAPLQKILSSSSGLSGKYFVIYNLACRTYVLVIVLEIKP